MTQYSVHCPLCGRLRYRRNRAKKRRIEFCKECSSSIKDNYIVSQNRKTARLRKTKKILADNGVCVLYPEKRKIGRPETCSEFVCESYSKCLNKVAAVLWENWKVKIKGGAYASVE